MPGSKRQSTVARSEPGNCTFHTTFLKPKPLLPVELIHIILVHVIGTYFSNILLDSDQDAECTQVLPSLLLASKSFRECTLRLLRALWGGCFISGGDDFRQRPPDDFGITMSGIRVWAYAAHRSPNVLIESPPSLPCPRPLRHCIHPFMILIKFYLVNVARVNARQTRRLWDPLFRDHDAFELEEVDVKRLTDHYQSIPPDDRLLLLGDVWFDLIDRMVRWLKQDQLAKVIDSLYHTLTRRPVIGLTTEDEQLELEDSLRQRLKDAKSRRKSLDERLAFINQRVAVISRASPNLKEQDLHSVRFYRMLAVLSALKQRQGIFISVAEIGRDCLRSILSDQEVILYLC